MRLSKNEKIVEKIALLLLTVKPVHNSDVDVEAIAHQAADMAYRANKALDDPSWWKIPGKPNFNERMASLKKKVKKAKKCVA
jgi:hypothetical protein